MSFFRTKTRFQKYGLGPIIAQKCEVIGMGNYSYHSIHRFVITRD